MLSPGGTFGRCRRRRCFELQPVRLLPPFFDVFGHLPQGLHLHSDVVEGGEQVSRGTRRDEVVPDEALVVFPSALFL